MSLCAVALVAATMLVAPRDVRAQSAVAADASALVALPIVLQSERSLNFGRLKGGKTHGTVVVFAVTGAREATGGVMLFSGEFNPAQFSVYGESGALYRIQLPASVFLDRYTGNNPMPQPEKLEVVEFNTFSENAAAGGFIGQIGPDGNDTFYLGGVLDVPERTKNGRYHGLVSVSIDYQ